MKPGTTEQSGSHVGSQNKGEREKQAAEFETQSDSL